jgi:transcriptional regulator with XRE-family HTH domain
MAKESTEFGLNLQRLRIAHGITQKELADRAGLNVNALAKLERGVNEPGWAIVLRLCEALGVPCSEFGGILRDRGSPKAQPPAPPPAKPRGRPKKAESDTSEPKPTKPKRAKGDAK